MKNKEYNRHCLRLALNGDINGSKHDEGRWMNLDLGRSLRWDVQCSVGTSGKQLFILMSTPGTVTAKFSPQV